MITTQKPTKEQLQTKINSIRNKIGRIDAQIDQLKADLKELLDEKHAAENEECRLWDQWIALG